VGDGSRSSGGGLYGHDEVNVATAGNNLGWPRIYGCECQGTIRILTWRGSSSWWCSGLHGKRDSEWKGSLIIGTLRSQHLHRVVLNSLGQLQRHECTYEEATASDGWEVVMGPDGELYVTTL